jgi:hypothetical protein
MGKTLSQDNGNEVMALHFGLTGTRECSSQALKKVSDSQQTGREEVLLKSL